jgi:hypothetical protein
MEDKNGDFMVMIHGGFKHQRHGVNGQTMWISRRAHPSKLQVVGPS